MGSSFFKGGNKSPALTGGNLGQEARALGSGAYAARGAAAGAQKDLGLAQSINKAGAFKPMKNSAAYPKGPKT
jgi:hypothetical protein